MSETTKPMFGITSETKSSNSSPLLVATKVEGSAQYPSGYKFPIAKLVNIIANPAFETKNGNTAILQFVFADNEHRQHIHTEWQLDANDVKFTDKLRGMNERIAHIYTVLFSKMPVNGIGTDAVDFPDFFAKVKTAFDSMKITKGEEKVTAYPTMELYYKLTIFNNRPNFPLSPNFLERVIPGKPCTTLTINLAYDKLEGESSKASSNIPGMGSAPSGDDLPAFDASYE